MKQNISKAAKAYGISPQLAHNRIRLGWDYADAISRPPRKYIKAANRLETSELFSSEYQRKLFAESRAIRQAQTDKDEAARRRRRLTKYAGPIAVCVAAWVSLCIVVYAALA